MIVFLRNSFSLHNFSCMGQISNNIVNTSRIVVENEAEAARGTGRRVELYLAVFDLSKLFKVFLK